MLVKSAFMGIAATLIDGKMLHIIVQIPVYGGTQLQEATGKLAKFWHDKLYLIIDAQSMVACHILALISTALSKAKSLAGIVRAELSLSGVNVTSDFHQFLPVFDKPMCWD